MNKRKIIIISILLFITTITVLIIYSLIPRSYIKFSTAPQEVKLSIDGKNNVIIKNKETIEVKPGHYKISISQTDFDTYIKEIDIKNGETNYFLVALNPLTNSARKIMESNKNQLVIQPFYEKIRNINAKNLMKNYPILKILPTGGHSYSIYSCNSRKYPNDTTKIAICISIITPDIQNAILNMLKEKGYNPDNYEIIWHKDYYQGQ